MSGWSDQQITEEFQKLSNINFKESLCLYRLPRRAHSVNYWLLITRSCLRALPEWSQQVYIFYSLHLPFHYMHRLSFFFTIAQRGCTGACYVNTRQVKDKREKCYCRQLKLPGQGELTAGIAASENREMLEWKQFKCIYEARRPWLGPTEGGTTSFVSYGCFDILWDFWWHKTDQRCKKNFICMKLLCKVMRAKIAL